MGIIVLNARCREIIKILIESTTFVTLQQIGDQIKVSKRTVYYDIYRINDWLENYEQPELEVIRGKGILIETEQKKIIEGLLSQSEIEVSYIFSPAERINIIICSIIYAQTPVYIEQLMEYCEVSRNTVFNDLGVVVNQLKSYDLKLTYISKAGYRIEGDTIKTRAVYLFCFNHLIELFQNGNLTFLNKAEIEQYWGLLVDIEHRLHIKYVEGVTLSLASLMPVIIRGGSRLYFPDLKYKEMEETKEYALVDEIFAKMEYKEKIYLCLHLLGSRVAVSSSDIFDVRPNQNVYEITKALVAEFEKIACVIFEDREDLEHALFVHINASLYRYQYGIQMGEGICSEVINEYPDLFEITRIVSKFIENQIGIPIPDGEIAYLALHFGAHLSIPQRDYSSLRILVVCANGISTGNMIRRELKKILPSAEIVGVQAVGEVQNAQNICDIIISTVSIKGVVPVIRVHSVLTKNDRQLIMEHPRVKGVASLFNIENIYDVVKPFVEQNKREKMKKALSDYLDGIQEEKSLSIVKQSRNLMEVLSLSHIKIHDDDYSWIQSIQESGKCLVESKSIEERYLDSIVSQIRYYGPYMFITPRVILAHAKPEDGVKHLDISLHIFKKSVVFSEFHKANIIIILAAEDQESHLKVLKDIVDIFTIQTRIDELLKSNDEQEVYHYIESILKS